VDYPPWPSEGTATFTDATPTAAKADPVRGNQTWDLTQPWGRGDDPADDNNWTFRFQDGMVIPTGTFIKESDLDNCSTLSEGFEDWAAVGALGEEINENVCNVAVEYFPATFWLSAGNSPPTDFGFIPGKVIRGGTAPGGTEMFGYEIKPDNFTGGKYNEAIQQFANWFQYYRKRVHLTRAAMGRSFAETDFLRLGFNTINNLADVSMKDMGVAEQRLEYFNWQYGLNGSGGTPNKEAVKHIGAQFNRNVTNAPILEACQRNFGMLVTDGFSNQWDGAGVGNADGPGSDLEGSFLSDDQSNTMADIAYSFYETRLRPDLAAGKVPTSSACNQTNPPLDVDCVDDLHMNLFAISLGARGLIFGNDEAATEDPFANPPTWPTSFPTRHPNAVDDIWHATLNTRGRMFSATRPDELVDALTGVLREIASRIQPVGVTATSTRLDEGSRFFQAELDSTTWSGDLQAREVNSDGEIVAGWGGRSAEEKLPSPDSRAVWTSGASAGEKFDALSISNETRVRIFGTSDPAKRVEQNAIIQYLLGDQSGEQENGGTLRDRDGRIGDIANARPTFAGPINEGWARLDSSYTEYLNGSKKNLNLVLAGANDGMLHAFDADNGTEEFAYIPSMVHNNLARLADPDYVHQFFVDGQVAVGDARLGTWTTVAVGGLGAGGKGIYALDIGGGGFGASDVMWELTEDHPTHGDYIGHVFGKPTITRIGGEWVAVFGNGYNSVKEQASLFIVRLSDGTVLDRVDLGTASANGLSAASILMDPLTRLEAVRAYAGDLKGNMWRVDFSGTGGSSSFGAGKPLITVDDDRPITSAPTLAFNPGGGVMVFFGSGKLIETADRVGTVTEFDRFWAVRDVDSRITTTGSLGQATMSLVGGQRSVTGTEDPDGWSINLGLGTNETGERVLSQSEVLFGQLVFTTFEPDDDPCAPGGNRRIYVLDALSGTGLLNTRCENCGVIEVGLGAPIDPAIVIRPPTGLDPFDDDGDGDGDGNGQDGADLPGGETVGPRDRWCSEALIFVPGEGETLITRVCEGRQVWRQVR
ncbi:MAG: PilC/PilY family type IV pilus protein, partial [Wenzhouxiangellaceae bacterium]|nr:PilC/PilY family type IV pilus protein [Wenzhouxiangellaceae bacterium]